MPRRAFANLEALDRQAPNDVERWDDPALPGQQPGAGRPSGDVQVLRGASRQRLRRLGPFVALIAPAIAFGVAVTLWNRSTCHGSSCAVSGGGGLVLAAFALPTAIATGIPWYGGTGRYVIAAATSVLVWLILGGLAASFAGRSTFPSWGRWWKEYVPMVLGLWAGVAAGLAIAAWQLGTTVLR
jgi:hypothetical protein